MKSGMLPATAVRVAPKAEVKVSHPAALVVANHHGFQDGVLLLNGKPDDLTQYDTVLYSPKAGEKIFQNATTLVLGSCCCWT